MPCAAPPAVDAGVLATGLADGTVNPDACSQVQQRRPQEPLFTIGEVGSAAVNGVVWLAENA
ncbi:MAG: hypothetical protein R2856_33025 [Caldilineaceae bacterium]